MKLCVIGCGKMGSALVGGAVKAGAILPGDLIGCGRGAAALQSFAEATGAEVITTDVTEAAGFCDVILLATKPQDVPGVLQSVAVGAKNESKLVISVAAGLELETLQNGLPENFRVVRAMPNTPAMVSQGVTAYCRGRHVTEEDVAWAHRLFEAVGMAIEVPEKLMDAVTGVSGSGPAYVYLLIEAMADGGVKAGLGRADALRLAAQTFLGAATMVRDTDLHPAVLKDMVTSPGGTTIAGLAEMERRSMRAGMMAAVEASVQRARELGRRQEK